MTNFYQILELEKGASELEIKKAFRRLAKKHHPESGSTHANEQKFQHIHTAYSILIDPDKRKYYDPMLESNDDESYLEDWKQEANHEYKKFEDMDYADYVDRKIKLYMFSADPKKEKRSVFGLIIYTLIGYASFTTWHLYPYNDIFSSNMFITGVVLSFTGSIYCLFYTSIYRNNKKITE